MPRHKTMHYEILKTSRWTLIVPAIKRQFMQEGIRFYETVDKRIWQADIFDLKLVPNKMEILPKNTRDKLNALKPQR